MTEAFHILQENFLSFVLSSVFGVILTVLVFYLTSPPSTSEEIRKRLKSIVLKRIQAELGRVESIEPTVVTFLAQEFDIHPIKSIVMFGTWEPKKDAEWYRWVAVFEPQKPGLVDKLVGRPGFYRLVSFTHMEAPYPDSLIPTKVETRDFDDDGIPEVHATLISTWADSISTGPLILRRRQNGVWQVVALPSISSITSSMLQGNSSHPENLTPPGRPFRYFGMKEESNKVTSPPLEGLKAARIYEDEWVLTHNGQNMRFVTLRNGGLYKIVAHPLKDYPQIATVGFFADGRAVLDSHYSVVIFLRLDDQGLSRDLLWNWGFPMLSVVPLRPKDVDLDAIARAGVEAHTIGNTFFGYTEFERQ